MAISSPAEMLHWLAQQQLLSAAQIDALRPLMVSFPDNRALARELVRRDWLSPFQVNQILQDKGDILILDSYRLRERLGEGAMGQVFKAVQPTLGRTVAIKMIHTELIGTGKALERFRREIETASQLDHPNIVHVLDAGEAGRRPYLVMEFVEGTSLLRRVKQDGPLPSAEAVDYARQTALGLQHALERGVVHRDIKPANLLLAKDKGGAPVVMILDFGLARFESEREDSTRLTEVGKMLGTIDYVAPEQATEAREADIRADIYSLGCTLFYLLTARPAFLGATVVDKLTPRISGEPPPIRTVRADVPAGLEQVILKMMARQPDDRYQAPLEVAQALAPYCVAAAVGDPTLALAPAQLAAAEAPFANLAFAQPARPANHDPSAATWEMPPLAVSLPSPPLTTTDASTEGPDFEAMTATGRDFSSGDKASEPPARAAKSAFPWKLIAAIAGGLAFLSLLGCTCTAGVIFFLMPRPDRPVKPGGTLRIVSAKWSMGDGKAVPGRRHEVLVRVERTEFKGPVKITLKDLPPGVATDTFTIPANTDRGAVQFTVSIGTEPLVKDVRVCAESEEAGARAEFPLTLTVKEEPFKFKK
jgi:hypothetical protein